MTEPKKPPQEPTTPAPDDVLRRMLQTPPTPHKQGEGKEKKD